MSLRAQSLRALVVALTASVLAPLSFGQGVAPPDGRYEGQRVVRVQTPTAEEIESMRAMGAGLWSCSERLGCTEYHVDVEQFATLQESGLQFDVLHENVETLIEAEFDRQQLRGADFYDIYRSHFEVDQQLATLAELRPDLARVFVVGSTIEGRFVRGIHIGRTDGERKALLIQGCQHAREWVTVMATTFMAEYIVRNADIDQQVDDLLNEMEFFIIPIVNPDGYEWTRSGHRLWRKNRRRHLDFNYGVDLNRNWGVGWGVGSGSSNQTISDVFRGAAPFSEPETRNIRDFVARNNLIVGHLDVHCFSQLVLGPWAYKTSPAPDADELDPVGQGMASRMTSEHGEAFFYGTGGQGIGYLAAGVAPDWSYGEHGARAYTFELRDRGQDGFLLPANQILPASEEALAGALHLAENLVIPCRADLNGDGVVNEQDLSIILGSWATEQAVGDVTRDARVGPQDIAHLLGTWGPCR